VKDVLGYCALFKLTLLEEASADLSHTADVFLSALEKEKFMRCVTGKRRTEFLGGRIAGKLAANLYRLANGLGTSAWTAMSICPQENGRPVCQHDDGLSHPLSLSHTHKYALGLVSSAGHQVGVDIEDDASHVRPRADMFHDVELAQMQDTENARLRWTLKETWCKLAADGIFRHTHDFITLKHADNMWLSVPSRWSLTGAEILAAGHIGALTVSMGFQSGVEG
jgi:phosphopantetheinyl transferase (holo-ACP synthase)